ncbi:hypothetical protein OAL44_01120 [Planctomycetaceae bacterium]|nr:hypothetical protein [Planctomycetaceae bacterium]MDC0307714.1 hypothetical protein [Planctomycetaceae bacterium]
MDESVDEFLRRLPTAGEIRKRLAENMGERKRLQKLLKVAEATPEFTEQGEVSQ